MIGSDIVAEAERLADMERLTELDSVWLFSSDGVDENEYVTELLSELLFDDE